MTAMLEDFQKTQREGFRQFLLHATDTQPLNGDLSQLELIRSFNSFALQDVSPEQAENRVSASHAVGCTKADCLRMAGMCSTAAKMWMDKASSAPLQADGAAEPAGEHA